MTTAPTPSRADALIREHRASMHPEILRAWASDAVDELRRLQAAERTLQRLGYQDRGGQQWAPPIGKAPDFDLIDRLRSRIAELERQLVAEARATAEHKLRADQLAQQHRMQAQMHAQATQQLAELEARKPLPLSDAEIIAAQESLARSRARIGLPCSRCESGKYRADSNAYHDFHRCDSCLHVPMWGEDGKEIGPPTCAGESS